MNSRTALWEIREISSNKVFICILVFFIELANCLSAFRKRKNIIFMFLKRVFCFYFLPTTRDLNQTDAHQSLIPSPHPQTIDKVVVLEPRILLF